MDIFIASQSVEKACVSVWEREGSIIENPDPLLNPWKPSTAPPPIQATHTKRSVKLVPFSTLSLQHLPPWNNLSFLAVVLAPSLPLLVSLCISPQTCRWTQSLGSFFLFVPPSAPGLPLCHHITCDHICSCHFWGKMGLLGCSSSPTPHIPTSLISWSTW